MVTAWLVNSMKPFIEKTYLFLSTTKDVWDVVRETYSMVKIPSQIFEIKTRLWQMKQGEKKVTIYYMEMTSLWQELDLSFEEEWLENERVFEFLIGVHRDMKDVRGQILGR
ncbi:hypothetical protein Patl1_13519 [Pistacia atlantica]|uniref:Uncharacterized protein n=1 Tax=Pistacia atlantica TaxID=434234 RepID=A0ACC1AS34_9ROSI|nr:hypothetical protein Patl1_13519 [Pistacia atlantica]